MSTSQVVLLALAPLYLLAFAGLYIWWDLRRRVEGPPVPSDQQVEKYALDRLERVSADVEGIGLRQSGMLALVKEQLDDSVEERKSAAGMKQRAQKVLREKRDEELQPPEPIAGGADGASEEEMIRAVEANLGPGPLTPGTQAN